MHSLYYSLKRHNSPEGRTQKVCIALSTNWSSLRRISLDIPLNAAGEALYNICILGWTIKKHKKYLRLLIDTKFIYIIAKGQLISKCLFGGFNFFQKTNENKSTWGIIVVKSNSSVHFLEESSAWKNHFDFVWPLKFLKTFPWQLFSQGHSPTFH